MFRYIDRIGTFQGQHWQQSCLLVSLLKLSYYSIASKVYKLPHIWSKVPSLWEMLCQIMTILSFLSMDLKNQRMIWRNLWVTSSSFLKELQLKVSFYSAIFSDHFLRKYIVFNSWAGKSEIMLYKNDFV